MILILVAAIWGSGFIATKIAVNAQATPMFIMALRFLTAALFLTVLFFKQPRSITRYDLLAGCVVGLFLFLGFTFQTYGIQYTTPSKNAFLTGVNVVIVPFIYTLLYRIKPKAQAFLAAFLCTAGIGLLTLQNESQFNKGDLLTLVCALFFALHIVSNGYFLKKVKPVRLAVLQIYFTSLFSLTGLFLLEPPAAIQLNFTGNGLLSILYLGLFSTCIAFLLQTIAQSKVNANTTALLLSLEALFGTLFSVTLLSERLTLKAILGGLLIFSAILTSEIDFKALIKKSIINSLTDDTAI